MRVTAMHPGRHPTNCSPQSGVSLIELMVALSIGIIVLLGTLVVYVKARDTYGAMDTTSRLQETARYAMGEIETDGRMAGYMGLMSRPDLLVNANQGLSDADGNAVAFSGCAVNWASALDRPATGIDGAYTLSSADCPAFGAGAEPGTDVLVIRRASANRITQSAAAVASHAGKVLLETSRGSGQIFVGNGAGTIPSTFAQTEPAANTPPLAETRELLVHAYYISQDSSEGVGYPSLRRWTLQAGPTVVDEEVVPGVEDLQVEYGVDTNDDRNADRYVNASSLAATDRVVSIRVWLRVRARQRDNAFTDTATYSYSNRNVSGLNDPFRRVVVSKTFELRNSRT